MLDPPYVYGVLAGDKEGSVAFWCKKLEKRDRPYMLVIKATDPIALNDCPAKIDWWNYPGGLSIEMRSALALNCFHYVTDPKSGARGHSPESQGNRKLLRWRVRNVLLLQERVAVAIAD